MEKPVLKPELAKKDTKPYNSDTVSPFVSIRSRLDARVIVTGAVTGKQYVWPSAGSITNVDRKDADEILNKERGVGCCGNSNADRHLFEVVY